MIQKSLARKQAQQGQQPDCESKHLNSNSRVSKRPRIPQSVASLSQTRREEKKITAFDDISSINKESIFDLSEKACSSKKKEVQISRRSNQIIDQVPEFKTQIYSGTTDDFDYIGNDKLKEIELKNIDLLFHDQSGVLSDEKTDFKERPSKLYEEKYRHDETL